jgi:hypothetical protein
MGTWGGIKDLWAIYVGLLLLSGGNLEWGTPHARWALTSLNTLYDLPGHYLACVNGTT